MTVYYIVNNGEETVDTGGFVENPSEDSNLTYASMFAGEYAKQLKQRT